MDLYLRKVEHGQLAPEAYRVVLKDDGDETEIGSISVQHAAGAQRHGQRPARHPQDQGHLRAARPGAVHAARLRRTAATMCGRWFSNFEIAPVLDHQPTKDANGRPLPAVTGKHYNHAQRKNMQEKRKVLYRWAAELRRIVGESATQPEQRLAA